MEFIIAEAMRAVDYVDQSYFKYLVNLAKCDHWIIEEIYFKCSTDNRQLVSFVDAIGVDFRFPRNDNLLTYLVRRACSTERLRTIIKLGVDRHHKNEQKKNALDIALERGQSHKINTLIDLGLVKTSKQEI